MNFKTNVTGFIHVYFAGGKVRVRHMVVGPYRVSR